VFEIECGTSLASLLAAAGGIDAPLAGVLIGGYFGSWLPAGRIAEIELSNEALARHGAAFGCGAIVALSADSCPVAETTRVAIYLATETANQCGPASTARPRSRAPCTGSPRAAHRRRRSPTSTVGPPSSQAAVPATTQTARALRRDVASDLRQQFHDHAANGPCDACSAEAVLQFPAGRAHALAGPA